MTWSDSSSVLRDNDRVATQNKVCRHSFICLIFAHDAAATMATSAFFPTPDAPRLRLALVNDNGQVQTNPESNEDPPESQTEASADTSPTASAASGPDAAASRPTSSGTSTDNNNGRAQAYLQQEGQKASHVFTGLTPDPHESSTSSESSAEDEAAQSLCAAKPASILLDCPCPSSLLDAENGGNDNGDNNKRRLPFRYGGLELRANSRSVEVYITDQSSGEEKYVVTSRGVKDGESIVSPNSSFHGSNNTSSSKVQLHKFVIVNRGGPATVSCVRIKLVSIQPAECDAVYVHACKVKAKLLSVEEARAATSTVHGGESNNAVTTPQRAAPQAAPSPMGGMSSMAQMMMAMGGGGQQQQQQPPPPPSMAALMAMMGGAGGPPGGTGGGSSHAGIFGMPATPAAPNNPGPSTPSSSSMPSHADMGVAISALRTMVSSTEESINRRIIESTQQLDASMAARSKSLESKVARLSTQVEEQSEIIMRQRNFIVEQGDAMKKMEANQNAMLERMLLGQNRIMAALESNRQSETTVEAQIDSVVGGSMPSNKRGEAKSEEIIHGEVRAIEMDKHEEECSAHAIDRYLDRDKSADDEHGRVENRQVDNGDMSDGANEETTKPPAMTYRGAENLLSFGEDEASDNALPSPKEVADEAISDLLTSALDQTQDGSAN